MLTLQKVVILRTTNIIVNYNTISSYIYTHLQVRNMVEVTTFGKVQGAQMRDGIHEASGKEL
jgi:hypothetical protein